MSTPGQMVGRTEFEAYMRRFREWAMQHTPLDGAGYRVQRTTGGWMLEFQKGGVEGAPGSGALKQFLVLGELDDYLNCAEWDGQRAGEPTEVAKPHDLRKTPWHGTSVTIVHKRFSSAGVATEFTSVLGYNYLAVGYRRVSLGGTAYEDQAIVPRYIPNKTVICAMQLEEGQSLGTGLTTVKWVDINSDGRSWARFVV